MRCPVYAQREPAYDDNARLGQFIPDLLRDKQSFVAGFPRPHDGDIHVVCRRKRAHEIKRERGIGDLSQKFRIILILGINARYGRQSGHNDLIILDEHYYLWTRPDSNR